MARRKKEPASVHRKNITSAASQLFTEKSVSQTSVDEIAKAAGYSKATLYVYFENKEEIFFDLVYQHMQNLYEIIKHISSQSVNTEKEWVDNYLKICFYVRDICKEYPIYFDGMIGNIPMDIESNSTPQVYKDINNLGIMINNSVKEMLKKGITTGYLNADINTDEITLFVWSSLSGIIRMSEQKKSYYKILKLDNDDFLKKQFLTLLNGCRR